MLRAQRMAEGAMKMGCNQWKTTANGNSLGNPNNLREKSNACSWYWSPMAYFEIRQIWGAISGPIF